jgi:hemerythrin
MSLKSKNLKMPKERVDKKVLSNDLVSNLKKDHNELYSLIGSFTDTLTGSGLRQPRNILRQIEDVAQVHFKFENDYLYPRMRRLLLVLLEKLCIEQRTVQEFIGKSHSILNKRNRLTKNSSAIVTEMVSAISKHLKDCDDVILLADKFGDEEKNELNKKLKNYKWRSEDER